MASRRHRLLVIAVLVVGAAAVAALLALGRLRTVQCALRSDLPSKDLTTRWYLECDDGASMTVVLPEARDGASELRFERGPRGLELPFLKSALSVGLGGSRSTSFHLPALEIVEGSLVIGDCDRARFREKARFLRHPPVEALEFAESYLEKDWSGVVWACQRRVELPSLRRAGQLEVRGPEVVSVEAAQLEQVVKLELDAGLLERLFVPRLTRVEALLLDRADLDQCTADALIAAVVPSGLTSILTRFSPCNQGRPPEEAREALAAEEAARRSAGSRCPAGMAFIAGNADISDGGRALRLPAFCLDVTEVTVFDYAKVAALPPGGPDAGVDIVCDSLVQTEPRHPVRCVVFAEAEAYCARQGKRLPTAAEWRWAARGGEQASPYPWGHEEPRHRACFARQPPGPFKPGPHEPRQPGPCAVGTFPRGASPQGVYDLLGNVEEWVTTPEQTGDTLALGGSFVDPAGELLLQHGRPLSRALRLPHFGFRCAASPASL